MSSVKGNMTLGNPLKAILYFSIPIIIGSLFQQLYNVVDTAVIGYVLGDNSLAALSSTTSIYTLIINFASGLTSGFSVIISQLFGAGNQSRMRRAVSLTYTLTLIISIVLTVACMIGINPLLKLLNTPTEIFAEASEYLRIILLFLVVTTLYNALASILRSVGNSKVPLIALIIATIINIILDILFVKYFSMGVAGAAYATVIAQAFSCIYCFVYIHHKSSHLRFASSELTLDLPMIRDLLNAGFSMALMLVVVAVGSVILQGGVNSFGPQIITAHSTARKIDTLLSIPIGSISAASATFAGQNYGAGRMDRVKAGMGITAGISAVWCVISTTCAFAFGGTLVTLLTGTSDALIVETAVLYMRINVPFTLALGVLLSIRSCLQGIGRTLVPILASVFEFAAKVIGVQFVIPALGYVGICILEPVIWVVGAILVAINFFWVCRKEEHMMSPS